MTKNLTKILRSQIKDLRISLRPRSPPRPLPSTKPTRLTTMASWTSGTSGPTRLVSPVSPTVTVLYCKMKDKDTLLRKIADVHCPWHYSRSFRKHYIMNNGINWRLSKNPEEIIQELLKEIQKEEWKGRLLQK